MADATIEIVGQDDLPTIAGLHNQIFRPPLEPAAIKRRVLGRYNPLHLLARVGDQPVGYLVAYEHDPATLFGWSIGVRPDFRRQGVATQLLEAAQEWAHNHHYEAVRFECTNAASAMLAMAIGLGYAIVGLRYDAQRGDNVVILELDLSRDE